MSHTREPQTNSLLALLEFSFHSASQAYGREFVRRVVLRHPLRTLRGLVAYARIPRTDAQGVTRLFRDKADAFLERAARDGARLLVGTGFCQKPLRTAGSAYDCPAGRFNHDCLYLSHLELDASPTRCHPACVDCPIRVLGHAALQAGASFAVLTSALDIAQDILLPALEERRFSRVLFCICPYSVGPMGLALLLCGMEGYLFHYHSGACANYSEWLRADRGDKPQCTTLAPTGMAELLHLLDVIAARRCSLAAPRYTRYKQMMHVFWPRQTA